MAGYYLVTLNADEHTTLEEITRTGEAFAEIDTGEFAAHLTQLACSEAPKGRSRWTVRLLAEKLIELQIVPTISAMTVCNTLKKELEVKPILSFFLFFFLKLACKNHVAVI